ncbi:uncharacterized protein LOC143025298 isoform X2 [Oratosquilla oratoria]|uniref:uncharacterized protein LOC143025298 isoform X2 n=1 Tax=Oratosquilla oratoria TaxID=337810 RepID=UPI003F762DCD
MYDHTNFATADSAIQSSNLLNDSNEATTMGRYSVQTNIVSSTQNDLPTFSHQETNLPMPSTRLTPIVPTRSFPMSAQTSLEKRKSSADERPSQAPKRLRAIAEEDSPAAILCRTASSLDHVTRATSPPKVLPRSQTYPRSTPRSHSRPKYPGPYLKNYTLLSIRSKISPGTFKLRRRESTAPRPSGLSFRIPSAGKGEGHTYSVGARNVASEGTDGECIVDVLTCSHDVTLYKIFLSFDGTLEVREQKSLESLRRSTSSTGQFVFKEPLVLEAQKSYGIYLNSRFESVAPYKDKTWKIQFGDVTLEWGHCAIVGGMKLLVSS